MIDPVKEAEMYVNNLRKIELEKNVKAFEKSEHNALRSIARIYRMLSDGPW